MRGCSIDQIETAFMGTSPHSDYCSWAVVGSAGNQVTARFVGLPSIEPAAVHSPDAPFTRPNPDQPPV